MNKQANYIKQRLSLRQPLKEALDIVVSLADTLGLQKPPAAHGELAAFLQTEKALVQNQHPAFKNFERDFPSLCFSIATGVGKTRLMGACISYLHLHKGVRNFFVLAPNLTIYEKLISDFGDPGSSKYVFSGIGEFVQNRPRIITGDNYNQQNSLFSDKEIRINVFNISKFNRDASSPTRGAEKGALPRIKRLSEFLGQSYWEYLSGLTDLVVLMDEAHRYQAEASKAAINELRPVLGLELTATPLDEKGTPFGNIVYEYNLAKALDEGKYVKNPAIATRKNFQPRGLAPEEVERIKLEDAINIHEDTVAELEAWALNNGVKRVKPFVLIVCKDIAHATDTFRYIRQNSFFNGRYAEKVLQIDSTKNDDENWKLLESIEQLDNPIEIVIHVNMLAEGWDVTNLYTICPLRRADSIKLVEQTIGRGLRLPYNGERTGNEKVDKLTVVSHDNFDEVIAASKNPDSVISKMSYVELEPGDISERKEVVTSPGKNQLHLQQEKERIEQIKDSKQKQQAQNTWDAKRLIIEAIQAPEVVKLTRGIHDYDQPEIKAKVIELATKRLDYDVQSLFRITIAAELPGVYESTLVQVKNNLIEIPRISLELDEVKAWFEDFDLITTGKFNYQPLSEEIVVVELTGEQRTDTIGVVHGAFSTETPVNLVVLELMNFPEIDYDSTNELLHKLATQAVLHIQERLTDKSKLRLVIRQWRKKIAEEIKQQMDPHFRMSQPGYKEPIVLPFVRLEDWSFARVEGYGYKDYRDPVSPPAAVTKYIYRGFEKACHMDYKFDSRTEKDFAIILERDKNVQRWMRPAPLQFRIYWAHNSRMYQPDFVIETTDCIYLAETKAADQLHTAEVLDKKRAALEYCKHATAFTTQHKGKPWKYLLIPHDTVKTNMTLEWFVGQYGHEAH